MKFSVTVSFLLAALLALSSAGHADEIVGMERAAVVAQFGEPSSALKSSSKEVLNYAQGKIVLVQGKVSSIEGTFSGGQPTEKRSAESPVSVTQPVTVVKAPPSTQSSEAPDMSRRSVEPFWWSHTLADAQSRSAKKDGRKILALFTGPDWCGPCQQLEAEVLVTDEFKRLGRKQFIPLKVALYMNSPQSPQAKAEYHKLSQEYGVEGVPNFVILNPDGSLFAKPDLFKRRKGVSNYTEQVMAAILEAEEDAGGMNLYMKIGLGVVLSGVAFVVLKR